MRTCCTVKRRKCRCMKFLCIISGCPAGAWKWHISYFCIAKSSFSPQTLERSKHESIPTPLPARNARGDDRRTPARDRARARRTERRGDSRSARGISLAQDGVRYGAVAVVYALHDQHRRPVLSGREGLLRRDRSGDRKPGSAVCLCRARQPVSGRARAGALADPAAQHGAAAAEHVPGDRGRHGRGEQARERICPTHGGHALPLPGRAAAAPDADEIRPQRRPRHAQSML